MVDSLSWFVGGNETQIRELQRKLNELGIQGSKGRLEEDGVYGKETQSAWLSFLNRFEHGVFPVLKWGDPLQSKFTGIETTYKLTKNGAKFSQFSPAGSKLPLFRVDLHAYGKIKEYYHINVKTLPNASKLQKTVASKLDHFQISKNAYDLLKNFDKVSKFIHVAGKVLLVGGLTLDVLELGLSIYDDLSDPDKKLGKKTISTLAGIGGRWLGSVVGSKLGEFVGSKIGTAIVAGPGTVIGGAIGGMVLGVAGSFGGDAFGRWVIDITYTEEVFS